MYALEENLVDDFISSLHFNEHKEWKNLRIVTEFDYTRGRTDIIALTEDGDIVAFEAKLVKWRIALQQAYKNTCFAHYSYVILPREVALKAAEYIREFSVRSVGICFLFEGRVSIFHPASRNIPLQGWLAEKAAKTVLDAVA